MVKRPKLFFLIAGLLFINVAGFFLRYFEFDTYFILFGFRFHFSILISFLFMLNYIDFPAVKEIFVHPPKQKFIPVLLIAFLPLLFIPLDMYVLEKFTISEQDYFFELGLSSIVDYPVYMTWNALQLFMVFIFMNSIIKSEKQKFIKAAALTFFLFIYEIVPLEIVSGFSLEIINYLTIINFVISIMLAGLLISRIKNIYLFTIVIFTILWGTALFFGSSSKMIINIFLASQYESWTGLINLGKKFEYADYLHSAYLLVLFIFSVLILKKNRISSGS